MIPLVLSAQVYERTGRNLGLYAGANTSFVKANYSKDYLLTYSASGGITHMVHPGIYPKIGYHFSKMPSSFQNDRNDLMTDLHSIEGSVLIDKNLIKLANGVRVNGGCHYLSIGLILAPEYRYTFSEKNHTNKSFGEFSLLSGLSFTHIYKNMGRRNKSRTTQYDIFFRKGFTPFYIAESDGEKLSFRRFEVGLSIRKIHHQVSNFLR
jgi:hypothetical protein